MRIAAKAIASVVVLTSAVLFTNGFASAKDQKYLLNCKLMDQSDLLFKRYCNGEKPDSKIVCQGDYCLIFVTNFGSQFGETPVISLTIGDGPASHDNLETASVSQLPTKGPTPTGPVRPTPGTPQLPQ